MSEGSYDSMKVEKGSIENDLKNDHEVRLFIKLKANVRSGVIPQNILNLMQNYQNQRKDYVELERPNWKSLNMSFYCHFVEEWRAIKIRAYNNECPIIKDIKNINFPCLVQINLSANHFMSVQILSRVNMPKLQNIRLPANCLISLKSLRKCFWPELKMISISRNQIQDWSYLTELFAPKDMSSLEYFENPDSTDFRNFMKMQAKKVPLPEIYDASFITERQEGVYQKRNKN